MLVLLEPYIGIGERLTAALREASSQLTVLTPQPHMAGSDVLGENIALFSTKRLENQTKSPTFESHVRKLSLFSDSEPWECQRILGRKCKLTSLLTRCRPHQPKLSVLPYVSIPKPLSTMDWHILL